MFGSTNKLQNICKTKKKGQFIAVKQLQPYSTIPLCSTKSLNIF